MLGLLDPRPVRELGELYRQLRHLISAGIPPLQMAAALEPRAFHEPARSFLSGVQRALREGLPLSVAAREMGGAIPVAHAALLLAGETTGTLDRTLDALVEACQVEAAARWRAWSALLKPLLLAQGIAWILPLPLLVTGGPMAYLLVALPSAAWPFGLIAAASHLVRRARGGDAVAARVLGRVPGCGDLLRLGASARACRALSVASHAGLGLPIALRVAAESAAVEPVRSGVTRAGALVARGASLAAALRSAGVIEGVPANFAAEGELTGRLDDALRRAAAWIEDDIATRVGRRIMVLGAVTWLMAAAYILSKYFTAMSGPPAI